MMSFHWFRMTQKGLRTVTMADKIDLVSNTLIQHGKENDRVYLMKLGKDDTNGIIEYIDNLAINDGYTKIIAKIPDSSKDLFFDNGYEQEAYIQGFFNDDEDVYFLSKYFSKERKDFKDKLDILRISQFCIEKGGKCKISELDKKFLIKKLNEKDIPQMTEIFKTVFESYPFPVFDKDYILTTMKENIDYFGVFLDKKLVAVSSSEMDLENLNTEMTDFAVLPGYRGNSLAIHLLAKMEEAAKEKGIKTAYTIARACSRGMNMTFAKMGYEFEGRLINNTNICGDLETMNVWYKKLI